jgi:predicted DNA-binding protein
MTIPALPEGLRTRLETLAEKGGKSVDDCVTQAIQEFVENWEEYYRTLDSLSKEEHRPVLRAVND